MGRPDTRSGKRVTRSGKRYSVVAGYQQQKRQKIVDENEFQHTWPEGKLLKEAAADPSCRLSSLPCSILSVIERALVTVRFKIIRLVDDPVMVTAVHHELLKDVLMRSVGHPLFLCRYVGADGEELRL